MLAAAPAEARRAAFFLDGSAGVAAALADADYTAAFAWSPLVGLALGAEVWLGTRFGLGPELSLDGGPLFGARSSGVTTGRLRVCPGLKFLVALGHGHAFFARVLVGGEAFVYGAGGRGGGGTANLGFAAEPGAGVQFRVARRAVVGASLGLPIGVHPFPRALSTSLDFATTFFVGYRR